MSKKIPNTVALFEQNSKLLLQDYKVFVAQLKREFVLALKYFLKDHSNLIAELMFVHRTTEYNDEGSELFTGYLNFKASEVLKYLIGDYKDKLLHGSDDYREDYQDYHPVRYLFGNQLEFTKLMRNKDIPRQVVTFFTDFQKIHNIFQAVPDHIIGEMFGEDRMVIIKPDGEIITKHFSAWEY